MAINPARNLPENRLFKIPDSRPLPPIMESALSRFEAHAIRNALQGGAMSSDNFSPSHNRIRYPGTTRPGNESPRPGTVDRPIDEKPGLDGAGFPADQSPTPGTVDRPADQEELRRPPRPGSQEEAARIRQAAEEDLLKAQAIYLEMAAARRKATAEAWAILQNLQTEIFRIWSEVYISRQKVMAKIAEKWSKLLVDSG